MEVCIQQSFFILQVGGWGHLGVFGVKIQKIPNLENYAPKKAFSIGLEKVVLEVTWPQIGGGGYILVSIYIYTILFFTIQILLMHKQISRIYVL